MSSITLSPETLKAVEDAVRAIPDSQVKNPTMPVVIYAQEATDLWRWVQTDKDQLLKNGCKVEYIDELPARIEVLRLSETQIGHIVVNSRLEFQETIPKVMEFLKDIFRSCRFAYRNRPELLKRIRGVKTGSGYVYTVQDIRDIATLGKEHPEELVAMGFDLTKLDQAFEISSQMELLLADVNAESPTSPQRIFRDKAYTYVKEAVDEVRAHGQFVFYNNDARRVGYASEFLRKQRRRNSKTNKSDLPPTTTTATTSSSVQPLQNQI